MLFFMPESRDGHGAAIHIKVSLHVQPWMDLSFLWAGVPLEQVSRCVVPYAPYATGMQFQGLGWGPNCNGTSATLSCWLCC